MDMAYMDKKTTYFQILPNKASCGTYPFFQQILLVFPAKCTQIPTTCCLSAMFEAGFGPSPYPLPHCSLPPSPLSCRAWLFSFLSFLNSLHFALCQDYQIYSFLFVSSSFDNFLTCYFMTCYTISSHVSAPLHALYYFYS